MALTLGVIATGLLSGSRGRLTIARELQLHACATSFGEADRNSLFGRRCAVLAFTHVMHFFAHKFSGLCAGRLAFSRILASAF
jgi:hypothetical protein